MVRKMKMLVAADVNSIRAAERDRCKDQENHHGSPYEADLYSVKIALVQKHRRSSEIFTVSK